MFKSYEYIKYLKINEMNNLVGLRSGKLLIIEKINSSLEQYSCQCDCGNIKIFTGKSLRQKHALQSCGKCKKLCDETNFRKQHPIIAAIKKILTETYHNEISMQEFYAISQMPCIYCTTLYGNSMNDFNKRSNASKYALDNGTFLYNGLDRIDNKLGHTINNIVPCCPFCNFAKRHLKYDDFKQWVMRIYNYWINRSNFL